MHTQAKDLLHRRGHTKRAKMFLPSQALNIDRTSRKSPMNKLIDFFLKCPRFQLVSPDSFRQIANILFIMLLLIPLEKKMVDYSLHNWSLKFLPKLIVGLNNSKIHQNHTSEGNLNVDYGTQIRSFFAFNVSKEAL